jgi:hypothetical protein
MKRRQYQRAFGEEHTHSSDRVNHLRNLLFICKTFKTSRKKVDERTNDKHFYELFYLATAQDLERAKSPAGNEIIKGG